MARWAWLVILASVMLRLSGIFRPLLGNFSFYQTAHSMIARFFLENGFTTLLYPEINILISGKPGLHLLAYPVSSLIAAVFYYFFGGSLDFWGRFQAVFFFAASSACWYFFIRKLAGRWLATASVLALSLSPLSIIYGQSFQNEFATLFFTVLFFHQLLCFLEKNQVWNLLLASLSIGLVLITRPNNLYLFIPALYMTLFLAEAKGTAKSRFFKFALVSLLGLVLPALWFSHIWHTIHTHTNIYSTVFSQLMAGSRLGSPVVLTLDYYQKLFDMIAGMALTPLGLTLFLAGALLSLRGRREFFFLLWAGSFLASSLLIPRKLIEHNFYLLHLVLPASFLMGLAFWELTRSLSGRKRFYTLFISAFLALSFLVSMRYAFHPAFKTPEEDRNLLYIAQRVKDFTSKSSDKIITQGTLNLLYYADRLGWDMAVGKRQQISDYEQFTNWWKLPEEQREKRREALKDDLLMLEYLRKYEGATHFVVTNPKGFYDYQEFARHMQTRYKLLEEQTGVYMIFKLT